MLLEELTTKFPPTTIHIIPIIIFTMDAPIL